MHRPHIARSRINVFPISWREILEQLEFVARGSFENGQLNFRAGHAGYFFREPAFLMRAMRQLEPEHIPPERQRSLEICDRNTGVVRSDDPKLPAHYSDQSGSQETMSA